MANSEQCEKPIKSKTSKKLQRQILFNSQNRTKNTQLNRF